MSVTATRNLLVRAGFDATGMRSGVRQGNRYLNQFGTNANNTMNSLNNIIGSTMSRIGKLIAGAFAIGAIVNFGKECLELGSNLSEVQNVVDVTFGSMANEVNEFAKNALTSFGLSETSAKKYTSTMGAMLKSSGFATDKALEMSKAITALSADMASFYNLDTDEAFEKIRSGISGETEPLKQLGINMSVANLEAYALSQGITKSWSSMTQAEQTLLRYNYLLSVTADAQGDFARTSDSWANQTRILSEQFNALKAEIGQGLIAAFTPIVKVLNLVVNKLRVAAGYFRAFMELIFGKQSSSGGSGMAEVAESTGGIADSANGASDAVGGIGDAASGAGKKAKKAAKEAKGALASFDELNQLNISKDSDSGSGSGGSGGSGGGGGSGLENMGGAVEVDLGKPIEETDHLSTMFDGLLAQLARMKDLFAEGFQIGLGGDFDSKIADIKESIEGIKTSLKDIFTDSEVVAAAKNWADSLALNLGKIAGSTVSIGATIAQNLLGGLDKYLAQNSQFIKDRLVGIMDASSEIMNLAGNFAVAFADIFSVFGGETGQQCTANIIGIFENAFLGVTELALKIGADVIDCITGPIIANSGKIKEALESSLQVFESFSGTILEFVNNTITKALEVYDTYVGPAFERMKQAFTEVLSALLDAYNTYVAPMLLKWGEEFNNLYAQYIQPFVDKLLVVIGKFYEMISTLWQNILAPFFSWLIDTMAPYLTALIDTLWSAAVKAIEFISERLTDILQILEGVIDFLTGVFSLDWGKAWQGICEIMQGIGESIYNTTIGALLKIGEFLVDAYVTMWNGVVEAIKNAFSPIVEWFNTSIIQPLITFFGNLWTTITTTASTCWQGLVSAWQGASQWFNTSVVEPIKQFFTNLWENLKQTATTCWQGVQSAWQSASTWFSTTIIEPIKQKFNEWSNNIKQLAATAWNGVKTAWQTANSWFTSTIITPIKTGFSNAWNNIKSLASSCVTGIKSSFQSFKSFIDGIISSIKNSFTNLWSNVTSSCKSAINGILNKVESGINSMANKVNSVTGKVGINVPTVKLPKLARGGIVDSPTIAQIGEAGKEMVVPLENTSFVDKLASSLGNAVMSAMNTSLNTSGGFGAENGQNVTLEMDGTTLARSMTPYIVKEMKRLGFNF